MLPEALRKVERHWFMYPRQLMTWLLVICNAVFTFATVVEARRTDYKADDCFMIFGYVVAFCVGFMVDVKKRS
jgi:hypothetical protein